ncbi:MAG: hypothetical protein IBX63_05680 [Coriobacteriia bacterium]|nr:hypothetical protein [Coriobacteriia bacterium]
MLVRPAAARLRAPLLKMIAVTIALVVAVPMSVAASPLVNLDFTLIMQSQGTGEPLLLVAGRLPEGTPLPAEIVLPVPEGSTIEWSGEILGTTVEEDVPVAAVIEKRDGASVAILTLARSLVAQVEVSFPGSVTPVEGDVFSGRFEVIAPADVGAVRLAVALPPGGQPVELLPGTLTAQGPEGYTYYYQEISAASAGDPLAYSIQYRQAATPPGGRAGTAPPASDEVPPLLVVLIAAVLAGAVLVVLASSSRSRGSDVEGAATTVIAHEEGVEGEAATPIDSPVGEVPTTPISSSWLTPQRLVIIAAVLVVGIAAAVILGGQQEQVGVTESADGWITQRISTASAESAVDFNVQITCDCPPEAEAPKMFDALRQVPGVAHAALEESTLLLRVQYDPAVINEAAVAQTLQAAGYLP